ncbi:MAG: 30S ribosomal protein S15 [Leptospiraceae bacterium]|nr:30S ribosomal protein S15 [Leptospiraceae bacterium]MCP5502834.1 30S ribosomal protein S15 [Leptospiraceae bacterium]
MITTEQKKAIIEANKQNDQDTGSPEVQISLLTARIDDLNNHFSTHRKDFHSRRGLIGLVNQRKKLLDYLKKKDITRYRELIQKLGLRK